MADWFMALPDPSNSQSFALATIIGVGAAWFGMYVSTGNIKIHYDKIDISTDTEGSNVVLEDSQSDEEPFVIKRK